MNPSRAVSISARIESKKNLHGLAPVGALRGGVEEPNIKSEVAFVVARYAVAVGRTILKGADSHGRAHLVWLTDRIRIATANQTDR